MKCPKCAFEGDKWKDWKRTFEFFPTFICPKCGYEISPTKKDAEHWSKKGCPLHIEEI